MHSLIAGIANSFTDNLIAEQRYRMILDGLQVTLLITFCAAVLGTLLGGVVCWARMSRKPWLRQTAKIYIDLMRGTPVLVLLMLMYYVFMAPLGTTGITVAVVTFAMNASISKSSGNTPEISPQPPRTVRSLPRSRSEQRGHLQAGNL